MKKVLAVLSLALFMLQAHAADYTPGFEYKSISQQPVETEGKVEVREFFWYGCPHCFRFDPYLKRWLKENSKKVNFVLVPAPLNKGWEVHTRAYYALKLMGELDKVHMKLFNAIHVKKQRLFKEDEIANFVEKLGVDKKKFKSTMKSFAVSGKLSKAKKMMKDYQVNGVPQIAINGKYVTNGRMAGGHEEMIKVMDYLVNKESKK